jgi:DNA-binding CsgD family transcriptional regulator
MTELAPDFRERLFHLTPKEQACLRLVGRRLSSKEIAAELGIAKTSVDTYCNRARAKLGVMDRYEAARLLAAGGPDAAASLPTAPQAYVEPLRADPRRAARLMAIAGVGFILVLAFATLLAGLRALEQMKPLY